MIVVSLNPKLRFYEMSQIKTFAALVAIIIWCCA